MKEEVLSKIIFEIQRLTTKHTTLEKELSLCPKEDWVKAQRIKKEKLAVKEELERLKEKQKELQVA